MRMLIIGYAVGIGLEPRLCIISELIWKFFRLTPSGKLSDFSLIWTTGLLPQPGTCLGVGEFVAHTTWDWHGGPGIIGIDDERRILVQ